MKIIILILASLMPLVSEADLLDRLKLEDSIRERVERTLHFADPNAKALVRFEFKSFSNNLPGTELSAFQELNPTQIETADISKITIMAYTELNPLPAEISESIYASIPFPKTKISLQTKQSPLAPKIIPRINANDISEIADRSVKTFSQILGLFALLIGCLGMAFLFFQNTRKMNLFRDQIKGLTSALAEGGMGSRSAPMASHLEAPAQSSYADSSPSESSQILTRLPVSSLAELMADCYWTEQDEYAHWIWKNLQTSQQSELYTHF